MKSLIVLCCFLSVSALAATNTNIAILTDGPSDQTELIVQLMQDELQSLADDRLNIQFPKDLQRNGNWESDAIKSQLLHLLNNKQADVVITLGIIGSNLTATLNPAKPVIAPLVLDAQLQGFPLTEDGTSGVRNLHYLLNNQDLLIELTQLQTATSAQHIALIAEQHVLDAIPEAHEAIHKLTQNSTFQLTPVPTGNSAMEIIAALPEEADAVFLLPLLRLSKIEQQMLIDNLNVRRLPSYSTMGRPTVAQGMLMGKALMPPAERLARQLAIDLRDILTGRYAGDLPVAFDIDSRLTLNLRTARLIDYSPPFEIFYEADLLHADDQSGRQLTLDSVVREALERNLSYAVAQEELLSASQSTRVARSGLLPQLNLGADAQALDRDLAGAGPTHTSSANLNLSQVIYSESARANYHIAKHLEAGEAADLEGIRLDTIQQAAQAYINVLVTRTQFNIQHENLKVTLSNLERAEFRVKVGSADRSEIFRFKTELSNNRQEVSSAKALYRQTMNQLNQILRRPLEEPFQTQEPGLTDIPVFGDERLIQFITNAKNALIFRDYMVQQSLVNTPELLSLKEQIAVQKRALLAAKRARYVPDITLSSDLNRTFDDRGAQMPRDYDEDWSVGLQLTLPLYQGGQLDADKQQARIELKRLELSYQQLADQIETAVRSNIHAAGASATNIRFAKEGAEAATKTLVLVTDAYTRGSASDVDLIDAQNASLTAHLSASNAKYQFLLNLMDVERAIGFFDFFVDVTEKEAWFQRFNVYKNQQLQGSP